MVRWLGEVCAVAAVAAGAWWQLAPLVGIIIVALYVLVWVNTYSGEGNDDGESGSR